MREQKSAKVREREGESQRGRERGGERLTRKTLFSRVEIFHMRIFSIMIHVTKYTEERERERAGESDTDVCAYVWSFYRKGRRETDLLHVK